jgi:hypothetical protein
LINIEFSLYLTGYRRKRCQPNDIINIEFVPDAFNEYQHWTEPDRKIQPNRALLRFSRQNKDLTDRTKK